MPSGAAVMPVPQVTAVLPGLSPPFVVPEAVVPFAERNAAPISRPSRVSFLRGAAAREILDPRMPNGTRGMAMLPAGMVRAVRPAGLTDAELDAMNRQFGIDPGTIGGSDLLGVPAGPGEIRIDATTGNTATPTAQQQSQGLTQAQAQSISAGIAGATSIVNSIFTLVGADNQRAEDRRARELAASMQQTQLRIQAENAAGNREQALRLAEMQMTHQRELAQLASTSGNTVLQQQLEVARQQMLAQQQRFQENAGVGTGQQPPPAAVPVWVYVAGAVALVGVGGAIIYAISTSKRDEDEEDAPASTAVASSREDMRADLARRRTEIRARIEKMRGRNR